MEVGGGAPPNGGGRGPDWPGVDQIGLIQAPARIEARGQRSPRHGLRNRERYGGNRVEDLAIPYHGGFLSGQSAAFLVQNLPLVVQDGVDLFDHPHGKPVV